MNPTDAIHRWSNRLAIALALATFPLIWMGGLVTTYGAGMAVPDWPQTYGYWFYYPLRSWLATRDIFLEHSHRMIGTIVGLLTVALAWALWRGERRRGVRWLGLVAIVGVSAQGLLGGLRVRMNEILLADIHGCVAPLFFALTTALVAITSATWQSATPRRPSPAAADLQRLSLGLTVLAYLQIVLGAQLRHIARLAAANSLFPWVSLHVLAAILIAAGTVWLIRDTLRHAMHERPLVRRAWLLGLVFVVQCSLGVATWVTKYGWPAWFTTYVWAPEYTVVSGARLPSQLTTAHVACGSLLLVTSLSLTLWTRRLLAVDGLAAATKPPP
jgi:cytochrome c oxidase assembly protein subunit 15